MLQKIRRLLFVRLLIVFVVTTLSISALVYFAIDYSRSDESLVPTRNNLSRYVEYLVQDIGVPPNVSVAKRISDSVLIDIAIIYGDQTWKSRDDMLIPEVTKKAILRPQYVYENHSQYYFLARGPFTFVFSIPEPRRFEFHPYLPILLLAMISIILFLSYKSVGRLFRPIQLIKEGAKRIGQGDLAYRLPEIREDELGELTVEINQMAEEVEKLLEAKRQLLLAISHELRSPITRATVTLEFIEDKKIRESLRQDLESMEKLTLELLETEKLNSRHLQLFLEKEDLRKLVQDVVEESFSDQKKRIRFDFDSKEAFARVDIIRMKLVIKNLIENALRYTPAEKPIDVTVMAQSDKVIRVVIQDYGSGISTEHLPYLAQAFYRADASRQRKTGGYGLGLYLCRLVVEAHQGKFLIQSELNQGTRVEFQIAAETKN